MKSFYSIIRYVSNQWSNESIAVGLLVVSGQNIFFDISDRKIQLATKLNPQANNLLKFSVDQLKSFVEGEREKVLLKAQASLELEQPKLNIAFAEKLHQYNSGILQFSVPESINKEFDQEAFLRYFKKIVGGEEQPKVQKLPKRKSEFIRRIELKLYEPLRGKVDVDYPLTKNSLPSLYFDFHLDNIGVNGAIIASSSVDLNHEQRNVLENKLAQYEGVVDRLKKFAIDKGIGSDHNFYLIADPYKGKIVSNMELDGMLQGSVNDKFKRITTAELDMVVKQVEEKGATKFSDILEKV